MTAFKTCLAVSAMTGLAACGNLEGANLIFGQQHTVGLTVAGSTADQGAELTLGFKDRNIAIVPLTVDDANGNPVEIMAVATSEGGAPFRDTMSVLGQFELEAGSEGSGASVGLGKFFATGMAARLLAEGFADKLAGQGDKPDDSQ